MKSPTAVVADLKKCGKEAMAYVIFSRVQKLSQIYLIDKLYEEKWKTSDSSMGELITSEASSLNRPRIPEEDFKILSLNILSLQKHYPEVVKLLETMRPSVLCLQETWIPPQSVGFKVPGYEVQLNSVGRGRGIATYFKAGSTPRSDLNEVDCQLTAISCKDFDVVNVYRSSSCQDISSLLLRIISEAPAIVCGDFNIDLRKNGSQQRKIISSMRCFGFEQLVKESTHDKGGLLDHVYVSEELKSRITIEKKCVRFSDHDLIVIKFFLN